MGRADRCNRSEIHNPEFNGLHNPAIHDWPALIAEGRKRKESGGVSGCFGRYDAGNRRMGSQGIYIRSKKREQAM